MLRSALLAAVAMITLGTATTVTATPTSAHGIVWKQPTTTGSVKW